MLLNRRPTQCTRAYCGWSYRIILCGKPLVWRNTPTSFCIPLKPKPYGERHGAPPRSSGSVWPGRSPLRQWLRFSSDYDLEVGWGGGGLTIIICLCALEGLNSPAAIASPLIAPKGGHRPCMVVPFPGKKRSRAAVCISGDFVTA